MTECKRCGHCCILFPTVILTPQEIASERYKINKQAFDGDIRLQRRSKWIPELAERRGVCIYYNPKTKLCMIHKWKPTVCKRIDCGGTQHQKTWEAARKGDQGW